MSPLPKIPSEHNSSDADYAATDEFSHPEFHSEQEHDASTDESANNSDDESYHAQTQEDANGYCLLPQESDMSHPQENHRSQNDEDEFLRFAMQRVQTPLNENRTSFSSDTSAYAIESVWSSQVQSESFPFDDDKANYIKDCMASVKLPESSVPPWAQSSSDSDWQEKLRERIACRQTTFFHKPENTSR